MSDSEIDLSEKIARVATEYPAAYNEVRDIWLEFVSNPSEADEKYVRTVQQAVNVVRDHGIEGDDRTRVIIGAFWAASAEVALGQRPDMVQTAADNFRTALENVWENIDG